MARRTAPAVLLLLGASAFGASTGASARALAPSTHALQSAACDQMRVVGHRGMGPGTRTVGKRTYTEDTVRSANGAFRYGADQSETDLRLSADGRWFQMHDASLDRTTNGSGPVRSRTSTYLSQVRTDSGAPVPDLHMTLTNLTRPDHVGRAMQLEIKRQPVSVDDLRGLVGQIRDLGLERRVLLTSSVPRVLRVLSQVAPEIARALVWYPNDSRPGLSRLPAFVEMVNIDQSQATSGYVRAAHRRGVGVSARSADTAGQWRSLVGRTSLDARPDQILTDRVPAYSRWCSGR